jgi:hypothetical protein
MTLTQPRLTPDEDAILNELKRRAELKGGGVMLNKKVIDDITKSCNLTNERAGNAFSDLHNKLLIYIPYPKEEIIGKIILPCATCGQARKITIYSAMVFSRCPYCGAVARVSSRPAPDNLDQCAADMREFTDLPENMIQEINTQEDKRLFGD